MNFSRLETTGEIISGGRKPCSKPWLSCGTMSSTWNDRKWTPEAAGRWAEPSKLGRNRILSSWLPYVLQQNAFTLVGQASESLRQVWFKIRFLGILDARIFSFVLFCCGVICYSYVVWKFHVFLWDNLKKKVRKLSLSFIEC